MAAKPSVAERIAAADPIDIWPVPKPLPTGLPPVATFDIALLPASFQPWVADISERMQVPPDFIGVTAMVAAGAVIGRKVGIRPQMHSDWYEVPNNWGLIIGPPGVLKSPSMQQAMKPINRLQADARREHEHAMLKFDAGEMERELRGEASKKAMKDALRKNPNADLSGLAVAEEEPPTLRRFLVNDPSYQVLGELLIENPNGMLLFRDEMMSLLRNLDREENAEARGFYLQSWNGTDDYVFDRIIRGKNIYVPSLTMSLVGSTQPGRIRDYASSSIRGDGGNDGLLQRFGLITWPDLPNGWEEHDREPDAGARNAAHKAFEQLDRMTAASIGALHDPFDDSRPFFRMAPEALEIFREWRTALEHRLRNGNLHPAMESHLAKYRKVVPSIALIHHLAGGGSGPLGEVSVLAALAWAEYLETHANRVYSASINGAASGAVEIVRHLRNRNLEPEFSAREIQRRGWSGLSDRERIVEALEMLEEYGWIVGVEVPTTVKGGRPTKGYRANPKGLAK